jgi:hypothetical protein
VIESTVGNHALQIIVESRLCLVFSFVESQSHCLKVDGRFYYFEVVDNSILIGVNRISEGSGDDMVQ